MGPGLFGQQALQVWLLLEEGGEEGEGGLDVGQGQAAVDLVGFCVGLGEEPALVDEFLREVVFEEAREVFDGVVWDV